jgi:hypothetical protein
MPPAYIPVGYDHITRKPRITAEMHCALSIGHLKHWTLGVQRARTVTEHVHMVTMAVGMGNDQIKNTKWYAFHLDRVVHLTMQGHCYGPALVGENSQGHDRSGPCIIRCPRCIEERFCALAPQVREQHPCRHHHTHQ